MAKPILKKKKKIPSHKTMMKNLKKGKRFSRVPPVKTTGHNVKDSGGIIDGDDE